MIKTILKMSVLLFFSASSLFATMAYKSATGYLEGYLNDGLGHKNGFKCTLQSSKTYRCEAENLEDKSGSFALSVKDMTLLFDKKRVEPILDEAVSQTYFKNVETAAMIERELDGMHFKNEMQRAIQKKRLEKRYLYDSSVQKRVAGVLFDSLDDASARDMEFFDKKQKTAFSVALAEYHNGMKESMGRYIFPKRILGEMSLKLKSFYVKNGRTKNLDANRSAVVWHGLRSFTPAEVPMIDKSDLDYFLQKSSALNGESMGDGLLNLKNSALDADTLMSIGRMEFDEPKRSKNRTVLKIRIENVKSLLEDSADPNMGSPDATLLGFISATKITPQKLQRYKNELKNDPAFKKSAEAVMRYISKLTSFYRKKSTNLRFRAFLDSIDRYVNSFIAGRNDTLSFRLENRSGLSFTALVGGFISQMMQKKQKESYPNQNIIEFVFDNFSMEFGNSY